MTAVRYDWSKYDGRLVALRKRGLSFAAIGRVLEVSPYAAQRRHRFLTGQRDCNKAGGWKPSSDLLQIRAICAQAFGVAEAEIIGMRRWQEITHARQATCWVIRRARPKLSYPCIGAMMGDRDHTTIIHAVRQVDERIKRDPDLAALLESLVAALGQRRDWRQHDAHVRAWQADRAARIRNAALAELHKLEAEREAAERARSENEFLSALDPRRSFCGQCDRAVTQAEASRCSQRLCPNRAAANGAAGLQREAA